MLKGKSFCHDRRRTLASLGAAALTLVLPAAYGAANETHAQAEAPRIVILDWGLTEVVLSLGVTPVGISRPPWYTKLIGNPPLPPSVVDTGLLFQPNFEVLQALRPDLIIVTPLHAPLRPLLERIAPTFTAAMGGPGVDVLTAVRAVTRQLGVKLGREAEAAALLQRCDQQIADAAHTLASTQASTQGGTSSTSSARRPVYLLRPIDGRHVTVFGPHSLFGGVLREFGFTNAWDGPSDPRGAAEADFAALAKNGDAQAVVIGVPPAMMAGLSQSPLWRALPFAAQQHVAQIGMAAPLGGMVSAVRFAQSLAQALQGVSS